MERDARAHLWDAMRSAEAIERFLAGRDLEAYLGDEILRAAVERQFEILGEALAQLSKSRADLAARIPDLGEAVAFRNVLIHGYASVDDDVVWRTAMDDLPRLRAAIEAVSRELE